MVVAISLNTHMYDWQQALIMRGQPVETVNSSHAGNFTCFFAFYFFHIQHFQKILSEIDRGVEQFGSRSGPT